MRCRAVVFVCHVFTFLLQDTVTAKCSSRDTGRLPGGAEAGNGGGLRRGTGDVGHWMAVE